MFKFESITKKELSTLFSLFGDEPYRDDASALLNIDINVIEMGVGFS